MIQNMRAKEYVKTYKKAKTIELEDGSCIILLDMLAVPDTVPQQDVERNILRLDPKGNISWIVSAQPPVNARSPFTGIGLDDQKRLTGYRWDGEKFEIDVNTGNAKPLQLSR